MAERSDLAPVAKSINDLADLLSLLHKGLARTTPWQRQLAAHLLEIDRLLQVLRMTVTMARPDSEIRKAAKDLASKCRTAWVAVAGSRADQATKAAVRLIGDLATNVTKTLDSSTV